MQLQHCGLPTSNSNTPHPATALQVCSDTMQTWCQACSAAAAKARMPSPQLVFTLHPAPWWLEQAQHPTCTTPGRTRSLDADRVRGSSRVATAVRWPGVGNFRGQVTASTFTFCIMLSAVCMQLAASVFLQPSNTADNPVCMATHIRSIACVGMAQQESSPAATLAGVS